jgi:hypothetical protein
MNLLPNEIFIEFFKYIEPIDILKNCNLVNHQWNNIAKMLSDNYWKNEFEKECSNIIKSDFFDTCTLFVSYYQNGINGYIQDEIYIDKCDIYEIFKNAQIIQYQKPPRYNLSCIIYDNNALTNSYNQLYKKIKNTHKINIRHIHDKKYGIDARIFNNIHIDYLLLIIKVGYLSNKIYFADEFSKNGTIEFHGYKATPLYLKPFKYKYGNIDIKKYSTCHLKYN